MFTVNPVSTDFVHGTRVHLSPLHLAGNARVVAVPGYDATCPHRRHSITDSPWPLLTATALPAAIVLAAFVLPAMVPVVVALAIRFPLLSFERLALSRS